MFWHTIQCITEYDDFYSNGLLLLIIIYVDFVKFINQLNTIKNLKNTSVLKKNNYEIVQNTQDDAMFLYFQTINILNKEPYHYSYNYNLIKKFISLNTKKGFKLKSYKIYLNALNYINNYFYTFDQSLAVEYNSYKGFFEFSKSFSQEFYKPDFLFKYIYNNLELIFLLKKVKPKKKLKKKGVANKVLINYIQTKTRPVITLRLINSYINNSSIQKNYIRVGNSVLYLALSGKSSFLYKKKIFMYNKLLEKKNFY